MMKIPRFKKNLGLADINNSKGINKKAIGISILGCLIIFTLVFPQNYFAGIENIICKGIAYLIRKIGDLAAALLGKDFLNTGMEKLMFNVDEFKDSATVFSDYNLSLLNSTFTTSLFKIYYAFIYIAISLLGTVTLLTVIDFVKTANDASHKAKLKSRLIKLLITIVLLLGMPYLLDLVLTINQAICDIFRLLILNLTDGSFEVSNILSAFEKRSSADNDNIVLSIIYLMAAIINIWLVIFYMIRDIAIAILFIISPLISIILPYKTDIFMKWLKEICSNIFTQSIQAFLMTILIVITSAVGSDSTFYEDIFALVIFAMFIPLTGKIKNLLGLEGDFGAARSNAGVAGLLGAAAVGGMALGSVKNAISGVRGGVDDLRNLNAEETLNKNSLGTRTVGGVSSANSLNLGVAPLKDNISSFSSSEGDISGLGLSSSVGGSSLGGNNIGVNGNGSDIGGLNGKARGIKIDPNNLSSSNRNHNISVNGSYGDGNVYSATSRGRQIQGMKRQIKKDIAKKALGGMGGVVLGGTLAAGAAALGNSYGSIIAGKAGIDAGNSLGESIGALGSNIGSYTSEKIQDGIYGSGVRYDGEQNAELNKLTDGLEFKNLFSGVSVGRGSSIRDNFRTIKDNYNFNKDNLDNNIQQMKANYNVNKETIKANRTGEGLLNSQLRATGLEGVQMTSAVSNELNARLIRNRYERRGLFQQAHRKYAKLARITDSSNLRLGNGPIVNPLPQNLLPSSEETRLIGSSDNPVILPNKPSTPLIDNSGVNVDLNSIASLGMSGVQSEESSMYANNTNVKELELTSKMMQYENNANYINALDQFVNANTNISSIDSQLC